MKKLLPIVAAITALFVSSCQKEAEKQIEPISNGKVTVLKASVTEAETKVSADAAGKFAWQSGDAITAFDNTNANLQFTTTNGGSDTEFTFSGDANLGTYALYPYDANHMVDDNYVIVSLPNEYTYKADETNMPMLGKIENNQASFKAIGGVLKLIIYNVPEGATKLTFTATNKQISGLFDINDASIAEPVIATADTNTDDDKSVTINFTRKANMVFYIPLPTGEINGFTLAFNGANSTTKIVTASFDVGRNKIINAPALNLSSAEDVNLWTENWESFSANAVPSGAVGNGYNGAKITYACTDGDGDTKIYYDNVVGSVESSNLLLSKSKSSGTAGGTLKASNIPTGGATSATLTFLVNNSASNRSAVSTTTTGVTIGSRSNSGSSQPYTITYPITFAEGVETFDLVFTNSSTSNVRIDDIVLQATIGTPAVTPTIEVGSESATISAGTRSASINGVKLVNPLDGTGIVVSSDADWLDAVTEGDYLGAGAKLTATAKSYNHNAETRTATITLKATGAAAKTVTFKQNPSLVNNPTSFTVIPGDKTFSVSWEGDSKAASYVAYYSTLELEDPTTGSELDITNSGATYTAVPKSGAVLANKTIYNIYVKVATVATDYVEKYGISSVWGTTTAKPVGEVDVETVNAPFTSNFKEDGQGKFVQDIVADGGASDDIWKYNSSYGMVATAYIGGTRYETEAWLLSPKISIGDLENPYVSFKHFGNYFTNTSNMKADVPIYIREVGGSWTQLNVTYPAGNNFSDVATVEYSLSAYTGKTVQFGWKYTSSSTRAGTYELDEFKVYKKDTGGKPDDDTFDLTPSSTDATDKDGTSSELSFTDGSTATAWYSTGTAIRIYGGGSFTVTAKENHKISKIVCTYSAASYAPNATSTNANYATVLTTGSTNPGSLTFGASSTWTCSEDDPAESVTITRNSGSGHWRLQRVVVSFAE